MIPTQRRFLTFAARTIARNFTSITSTLITIVIFGGINVMMAVDSYGQTAPPVRKDNYQVASSSKESYQTAVNTVPWKQLEPAVAEKIGAVIRDYTIYRRLPQQAVYSEPDVYNFFLKHPDYVVAMWEQLGVTELSLAEIGADRFQLKETSGTVCIVEVLYRSQNVCVVYGRGVYRGSIIGKSIEGEVVLVLQTRFGNDEKGDPFVVCRMDSFAKIHNIGAEVIAKLLAPVVGKIVDGNFEQTIGFVGHVSDTTRLNMEVVYDLATQCTHIRPEVRREFLNLIISKSSESPSVPVSAPEPAIFSATPPIYIESPMAVPPPRRVAARPQP